MCSCASNLSGTAPQEWKPLIRGRYLADSAVSNDEAKTIVSANFAKRKMSAMACLAKFDTECAINEMTAVVNDSVEQICKKGVENTLADNWYWVALGVVGLVGIGYFLGS